MGDEARALEDLSDEGYTEAERLRDRYNHCRNSAPIGEEMHCPVCFKVIVKKTRGHVFCRSKGPGNCKDRFWNITDPARKANAKLWR